MVHIIAGYGAKFVYSDIKLPGQGSYAHVQHKKYERFNKPNIILIIADDQSYTDFGFMGNQQVKTPYLDKLASESALYTNGYVTTSICSPSLATLLSGLYPHQSYIHYNHPPPGYEKLGNAESAIEYKTIRSRGFTFIRQLNTLPRLLKSVGYTSFQSGKFWEGHFSNAGFSEGMTIFEPVTEKRENGYENRRLSNGELVAHGHGDHGLAIGRETMGPIYDFIERNINQPFFIWYAPYLPHSPHNAPGKFTDMYRDNPEIPPHKIPYYSSISFFDHTVGELLQYVEDSDMSDNTLFLFIVDNGWQPSTEPDSYWGGYKYDKRSKKSPFDYGLRTPILIHWKNKITHSRIDTPVSSIDIVPTLASVAGVPESVDTLPGISLLPSAFGEGELDRERPIFGKIYPSDASSLENPSVDVQYLWVRLGDYKLITTQNQNRYNYAGDQLSRDAMFNVVADPQEKVNLIDLPTYKKITKKLYIRLESWWTPSNQSVEITQH